MPPTTANIPQMPAPVPDFAFLTNHAKTLILIAHDHRIRIRDIATGLHITERTAQRIVADLAKAGYVSPRREGRRNVYTVTAHLPLGLPVQRDINVGSLLAILLPHADSGDTTEAASA
jgi:DNA-binding IclR family transcriptional regulator